MPAGVPVATVAVNGAFNAGLLAAQILSVGDPALGQKLQFYKDKLGQKVMDAIRDNGLVDPLHSGSPSL
jgi:5-(carboxyamino)imidazole ribonucleotide mutase